MADSEEIYYALLRKVESTYGPLSKTEAGMEADELLSEAAEKIAEHLGA